MPAPRRYVTDAIVLSRFDLGEADRVLTLITPHDGKLKAIAKGVRRTTSRLGGSLEPFAELRVALARGRTFDVVTEVHVGHAWLQLRDRLESTATAWYLAELADRSLEERHAAEPLYALLRRAYELLDAGMAPGRVARWYEMHLADELGQRPEVDRCVECDRMLEATETFRWVPPLGGALCGRCPGPPAERTRLSLEALKLLKAYQRLDIEAIAALRLPEEVDREVEGAMRDFMRVALERDPRSLAFLDEVRSRRRRSGRRARRPPDRRLATVTAQPRRIGMVFDTGSDADVHALDRLADRHDRLADHRDARTASRRPSRSGSCGSTARCWSTATGGRSATANIGANPRVALHLDDDGRGNDIVIVEGEARIDESTPPVDRERRLPRQVRRVDPRDAELAPRRCRRSTTSRSGSGPTRGRAFGA